MQEITVGKKYRHYKGNIYEIIALAKHSETCEDMVVYQNVEKGDIWVRPKSMWNELVDPPTVLCATSPARGAEEETSSQSSFTPVAQRFTLI